MEESMLRFFIKEGFLLDKEMLKFFNQLGDEGVAKEIVDRIAVLSRERLITKTLVIDNLDNLRNIFKGLEGEKKEIVEKFFLNISLSLSLERKLEVKEKAVDIDKAPKKAELSGKIKILSSEILASKKLEVGDFVKHFRNRYGFLKGILQERAELGGLVSIDKIGNNRNFSIIGIVSDKRVTKNKNILLEVEDLTGRIRALINKDREGIYEKAKEIVLDDILGFKCAGNNEIIFVNDLFYPDAALLEKKRLDEEIYALFISDMHVGSNNFLEENFSKFIGWLNGENVDKEMKEKLEKIKYIFVTGDSIDGVGIFPGQEELLKIKDITEQYEKLAEYLSKVPKHIKIIMCPGQHDATRVAEPQPPPGADFAEPLMKIENLFLVSNPAMVEIEGNGSRGLKILMYHGASMHGLINEIEELRLGKAHDCPAKAVKYYLKKRHLAPTHSSVVYVPGEKEDPLLIKEVPDVITTGEVHKPDIDMYNNILIICNSCWQSITPYEEKVGNHPDPCKVPMLNLKTREVKILDFS